MKPVSDGGKKDSPRPCNAARMAQGLATLEENNRRAREEGLEPMTQAETEAFLQPRINRQGSTAVGFAGP